MKKYSFALTLENGSKFVMKESSLDLVIEKCKQDGISVQEIKILLNS